MPHKTYRTTATARNAHNEGVQYDRCVFLTTTVRGNSTLHVLTPHSARVLLNTLTAALQVIDERP